MVVVFQQHKALIGQLFGYSYGLGCVDLLPPMQCVACQFIEKSCLKFRVEHMRCSTVNVRFIQLSLCNERGSRTVIIAPGLEIYPRIDGLLCSFSFAVGCVMEVA